MKRILVVEDDPAILKGLEVALREENYEVMTATDGAEGFRRAHRENLDLIILDIMLPGMDGLEICRRLRGERSTTPIIMLTSRKEEVDKVLGLELGADDYVTKPFSIRELKARIRACMRRPPELVRDIEEYAFGDITLDFKKLEAKRRGDPLKLSAKEFEILKYLILREGEVVTRDMLLDDVWGYEQYPTTRTVDNYILSLRKKIETDPSNPEHLLTVHTAGYKFNK